MPVWQYLHIGFSLFVIAGSLLPFIKVPAWWIRIFDFPRAHLFFSAILMLALLGWWPDAGWPVWSIGAGLALACVIQAVRIYPFTPLARVQSPRTLDRVEKENLFSVLISNVRKSNRDADRLKSLVEETRPDIIIMNEPDNWWEEQTRELDKSYPYQVKHPLENTYGIILFSKLELIHPRVNFYLKDHIPSIISAVKLPSGNKIMLYCLHPEPPDINNDTDDRDAELLIAGKEIKESEKPSIIAGDLNDVGWSHTTRLFKRFSKMLDPRVGRGMFNTFNARIPIFRYPLDHIFHTDHFRLHRIKKMKDIGSDHFPIFVAFEFVDQLNSPYKPTPDNGDKEEAEGKMEFINIL